MIFTVGFRFLSSFSLLLLLLCHSLTMHGIVRSFHRRPSIFKTSVSAGKYSNRFRFMSALRDQSSITRPNFEKELEEKYFEFNRLEKEIYQWWEQNGYFQPEVTNKLVIPENQEPKKRKRFVVPMPPPNVTGYLHMGHAIFLALQDIMIRFYRMKGFSTVWVPGTDHAGIATQLLVEKALAKEGLSRIQLGREKFLEKVWQWKHEKGDYIISQMKRLGASADWSRQKFTLDPDMNEAVTEAFIQLYEKGLIYQGSYLVNWSPSLQTAVSDLEVEYTEEEGTLYYFKYPLAENPSEYIPVATTRPETILGDTAVCVHPNDTRYAHLIGKLVTVPMINRRIPVIADNYVDPNFGTGALKITPGHDVNDYAIGQRHRLPIISILNKDATINQNGYQYTGLDRFRCRERLWADMKEQQLVIKEEKHLQRVPRSQRSGEIIEPMISSQWFVKMSGMADRAVQVVRNKELTILPERFEKIWYNWLENIHDWCISRQLWWGHRIPVYYIKSKASVSIRESDDESSNSNSDSSSSDSQLERKFVVARNYDEAWQQATKLYGQEIILEQEEDVLDTWFSSGLWPFATVGWPHQTSLNSQYDQFYPASVLETGYDILFFWVARMVTMGMELTGKTPFHTIYLHGLVRDGQGQKMSKTKGNVIDPIDTIDQFGTDALRFALVTGCSPGQDIPLSMERIESYRNFVNKLWNIGKFLQFSYQQYLSAVPPHTTPTKLNLSVNRLLTSNEIQQLALPERYIITRCHEVIEQVTQQLESYQFHEGGKLVYDFVWNEFADWYIEISKFHLRRSTTTANTSNTSINGDSVIPTDPVDQTMFVLTYIMDLTLRLLHPYMPFITETLYQTLPGRCQSEATGTRKSSLMVERWPTYDTSYLEEAEESKGIALAKDTESITRFNRIQALIKAIRNIRAEYQVDLGLKIPIVLYASSEFIADFEDEKVAIGFLAKILEEEVEVVLHERTPTALLADVVFPFGEAALQTLLATKGQCVHVVVEDLLELYIPQRKLFVREKELQRITKQMEKISKELSGLTVKLGNEKFLAKAPVELVEETKNKVNDLQAQYAALQKTRELLLADS